MFGIGKTIGTTWQIMKDSAAVLRQDKELMLFPVFGVVVSIVVIILGALIALAVAGGTAAFQGDEAEVASAVPGLIVVGIATYLLVTFVFTFFNAALVGGALERIRGGDPTIGSSLSSAGRRFLPLLGWAIIAGTVSLIISALRSRAREQGGVGGVIAAIGLSVLIAIWEFITFFTVPVIVAEGHGPIGAIRRSYGIVKKTWGKQLVAGFGFGLFYFLVAIPGILIGGLVLLINPIAGFVVGGVVLLLGVGLIHTLSSIFKAVLYNYAVGGEVATPVKHKDAPAGEVTPSYKTFNADFLSNAYRQK